MSRRRFFKGLLIVAVLFFTINTIIFPYKTEAVAPIVGRVLLSATEKSIMYGMVRGAGIAAKDGRTAQKIFEGTFFRFPDDKVNEIRQVAKNAVPDPERPGWIKVVVSGALLLTGLDVVIDIYNLIQANQSFERETQDILPGDIISQLDAGIYGTLAVATGRTSIYPKYYRTWDGNLYEDFGNLAKDLNPCVTMICIRDIHILGTQLVGTYTRKGINYNEYCYVVTYLRTPENVLMSGCYFSKYVPVGHERGHIVTTVVNPSQVEWDTIFNRNNINPDELYEIRIPNIDEFTDIDNLPLPELQPVKDSAPNPVPVPDPNPVPQPEPYPDPWPEPGPEPFPEPVPNPPNPWEPSEPGQINWEKLKGIPAIISTKFPFSLPWDVYHVLSLLNYQPRAPVISINEDFMGLPFQFEFDFSFLDPYIVWFRWFIVVGYVMFLIMSVRKLMGGGV